MDVTNQRRHKKPMNENFLNIYEHTVAIFVLLLCWLFHFIAVLSTVLQRQKEMSVHLHVHGVCKGFATKPGNC